MTASSTRTRRGYPLLLLLVVLAPACAKRSELGGSRAIPKTEGASDRSAMQVYRDPVTGRLGPPPLAAPGVPQAQAAPRRTAGSFVETPSPRGGVVVDLHGRFDSNVTATAGADGGLTAHCTETGRLP
jgi:hypothetical protein